MRPTRPAMTGFSLLELLVALTLFAITMALAYGGLDAITRGNGHLERVGRELVTLQQGFAAIERDMSQLVARGRRDSDNNRIPPLLGDPDAHYPFEFTRSGWLNPLQKPRSELQRVVYHLDDGELIRRYWQTLDPPADEQPRGRAVMEGIEQFTIRYLDGEHHWQMAWPPASASAELPIAIEITVESRHFGRIKRLYDIGIESQGELPDHAG